MLYADRWVLCADVAGRGVTSRERRGGRREGRGTDREGGGMRRGERRRDEGESGGMTASKENKKTIMTPVIHTTVSIHHKGCCGYLHSMPQ